MKISEIDHNFHIERAVNRTGIRFYDASQAPMRIYGVVMENGRFRRIPEEIAQAVSKGVHALHANTAGGRVRFQTDSPFVVILAKMENIGKMSHFSLTGSAGFDLYENVDGVDVYRCTFAPPYDMQNGYESRRELGDVKMREITINFPLYSDVVNLCIGVDEHSTIKRAREYRIVDPVVYYGSSITQGGCASRPGNSYQAMISRRFQCDYLNLGFSGNAMAENTIAEYIGGLQMSCFVFDYDHNAPSVEYLKTTHEKMFHLIRQKQPNLPIVIMSRPKQTLTDEEYERLRIITETYQNAVADGDQNVYMLDGKALTRLCSDDGTVDNAHPNDFGFASIAQALGDLLFSEVGCPFI